MTSRAPDRTATLAVVLLAVATAALVPTAAIATPGTPPVPELESGTWPTTGTGPATPIDSCTTLDSPGTYVLARDLAGTAGPGTSACVAVTAPNVTLRGAGHRLSGTGGAGTAVAVRNATGVAVRNLSVRGYRRGIDVRRSGPVAVAGLNATGLDGAAVRFESASGRTTVAGVDARRVGTAVEFEGGGDLSVRNVSVVDAADDGVWIDAGGNVSLSGVDVTTTGRYGVYANAGGDALSVRRVRVRASAWEGLELLGSADVSVEALHVEDVAGGEFGEAYDGLFVDVRGNVSVANVTVRDVPVGRGAYVYAAVDGGRVSLRAVTVERTRGAGLRLGSYGGTVLRAENLSVRETGGDALRSVGFARVGLASVTAVDAGGAALRVTGTDRLRLRGVLACASRGSRLATGATVDGDLRSCVAVYAGPDGGVDDLGLRRAVDDWAAGRIDSGLLREVLEAWVNDPRGRTPGRVGPALP